ncbi:hypothetical protein [Paraburkholderia pallida]|uniref:Fis family transcriptional regulator n=1 Tax=Paraburkholderia pallida TaxID=2547399 RepID=A0A4P7CXR7_9BURK|nr:hypothetical protein [Paraburkholderia pallida]QBR00258.1 hypothetical protein E1956_24650 [Paraburkholderia pallida]
MAKTIPFPQHKSTRARRNKAELLPMPRASAEDLALQVHLALASLRADGTQHDAQALLHAHVLAQSIAGAGYGALTPEQVRCADEAILACFARGGAEDDWRLDDAQFEAVKAIVSVYDHQLQSAPFWVLAEASERLERMRTGEARQPMRKRA